MNLNTLRPEQNIRVMDAPGDGGGHHLYRVAAETCSNRSWMGQNTFHVDIPMQNGPLGVYGINGVFDESLLEIVKHRLDCFQAGDFACKENQAALEHVEKALEVMMSRRTRRANAGVLGSYSTAPGDSSHVEPKTEPEPNVEGALDTIKDNAVQEVAHIAGPSAKPKKK